MPLQVSGYTCNGIFRVLLQLSVFSSKKTQIFTNQLLYKKKALLYNEAV